MIVAIATPAAQAAITAAEGTGVTVLFTGVGEVSALGLEEGQKVTGVASPTPVNSLVDLAVQSGSALQTLGLLYDAGEPGALAEAERVKSYCSELGLTVVESTVASEEEAQQAATELCAQVDALYTPADSTIAPAAAQVAEAAKAAGVPWYTGDASMVQAGALASMGSTGREMGVAAADMAVQLIQGQELAQVPAGALSTAGTMAVGGYALFLLGDVRPEAGGADGMLRRLALLFALLAGAVLLVLGQLGSALAAQVDRPFLQMVSGLGFEGAFQRLEELVSALWVLGDVALLGLLLLCLGRLLAWLLDRPVGKGKAWLLTGAVFLLGLPAALGDHPLAGTWVPFGNLAVVGLLVLTLLGTGEEKKLEKSEKRG